MVQHPARSTNRVTTDQLATFLFSALLSSESLLVSAFGALYAAYLRAIAERRDALASRIRPICYLVTLTMCVISAVAFVTASFLSQRLDEIFPHVVYALYAIVVLIDIPPIVLSYGMRNDAAPD